MWDRSGWKSDVSVDKKIWSCDEYWGWEEKFVKYNFQDQYTIPMYIPNIFI